MNLAINEALLTTADTSKTPADVFVKNILPQIEVLHQIVRDNRTVSAEAYKKKYDKHTTDIQYPPGARVWLRLGQVKPGESKKLAPRFVGPFYVEQRLDQFTKNYILRDTTTHKLLPFPIPKSRIKMCYLTDQDTPEPDELEILYEPITDADIQTELAYPSIRDTTS